MPIQGFDQTLSRFGLEKLKRGLDLQLTKSGDIAFTRDGDLQVGNTRANGMFRFIERWRRSESTITALFAQMAQATATFEILSTARHVNQEPLLWKDLQAYHEVTDAIVEAQLVSSTLAGSIAVILNNLFQRLRLDLNATENQWCIATPLLSGRSIGEIFSAAAANFRHYDEWAATKSASAQQLVSMNVLAELLNLPIETESGFPAIRTNVCGSVLMFLSQGSVEALHQLTIGYAKSLSKYE